MLPDAPLPWLPLPLVCGVALQAASLLCGRGWLARVALLCGGALVCLYAARERDITLAVGQAGIVYVLWRMRFSATRPPAA
ncbi:MAG: hypothetical protein LBC79_07475 [Deltaproteobacteria bacterium]|jgi:hypothetical protein|nr:hypothetical protein [Deltaproteobacteria bacterium]